MRKQRRKSTDNSAAGKNPLQRKAGLKQLVTEPNQNIHDVNAKTVLGNPKLCAQFLRDYVDVPGFKGIKDDDIEDVTQRYASYFGVEYNADTVKKVHIKSEGQETEVYVISLIDHKSQVDYNVSMQLLKYMACIWAEYEKKLRRDWERKRITDNKSFKYPPILPIIYYEGKDPWTADRGLKDRILLSDAFDKYIPNYEYIVVRNHDYTNDELLEKKDEMSLIMLLNKIQTAADLGEFLRIPAKQLDDIIKESPNEIVDIIVAVMRSLCERMNVTNEEKEECVRKVGNRQMGYLFENMEKMDIQEERRKNEEQRRKTEEQRKRADHLQRELSDTKSELSDTKSVFKLSRQGKTNTEIAQLLNMTEEKVKEILGD